MVRVSIKDEYHPVKDMQFSLDGQEWQRLFPTDGINDTKSETYQISLSIAGNTEHSLVVKATDNINNYNFNQIRFKD